MLTDRTNILLDHETRILLSFLAKKEKTSMGDLIRRAIYKVYKKNDGEIIRKRAAAIKKIRELQKKMKPLKGITYRELIEYGRYR